MIEFASRIGSIVTSKGGDKYQQLNYTGGGRATPVYNGESILASNPATPGSDPSYAKISSL